MCKLLTVPYGTRKIKKELEKRKIKASRRKIGRIIEKYSLISNYKVAQYKPKKSKCNEEEIENIVNRDFKNRNKLEVIVSDLTYVRVGSKCVNDTIKMVLSIVS